MRLVPLASSLFLALTGFVAAQPYDTPAALLEAFYAPYVANEIPDYDESQFFSQDLQALYAEDAANTPEGEMGAIEFDPFVDGQDYEITDLAVGTPAVTGDTATVDVSFKNFGTDETLTYDLVQEDGWKIDDVASTKADNPYRLSEIFAAAATR